MVIIRYNEPQEQNSFIRTANDFYYSNGNHTLSYSYYAGANQLLWAEIKDVDVELSNMNAVPVLYVRPCSARPKIFDQPKDAPWSETTS